MKGNRTSVKTYEIHFPTGRNQGALKFNYFHLKIKNGGKKINNSTISMTYAMPLMTLI